MEINIDIELDKIKNKSFNNEEEKIKELEKLNDVSSITNSDLLFEIGKSYFFLNKYEVALLFLQKSIKNCIDINEANVFKIDLLSKVYMKLNKLYFSLRLLYKYRRYFVKNANKEIISLYINKQRYDLAIKYINIYLHAFHEKKYNLCKYAIGIISHLNVENNRRKVIAYSKRILKYTNKDTEKKFYNSILNELEIAQRKIILKSYPRRMTVSVINTCNLRCKMCHYNKNIMFKLSKYQVDNIIRILPYIEEVEWNGGEVFLFKYLDELLDAGYKNNVKQYITSNGLLISDKYAKKIVDYDINLTLSIDSVDKTIYENIRVGAKFDLLLNNIKNINYYANKINKKLNMSINAVLSQWNYKNKNNFIDIIRFAKKYNFSNVRITVDQYCDNKKLILDMLYSFDIQKTELVKLSKELGVNIQFVMPSLTNKNNILDGFFQIKKEPKKDNIEFIDIFIFILKIFFMLCKDIIFGNKTKKFLKKQRDSNIDIIYNDDYIKCSMPFKKIILSFKGDIKSECICPEFICHLCYGSFFKYYYSKFIYVIYKFCGNKEDISTDKVLNTFKIKTDIVPLPVYKTIEEIWNSKELQDIRLYVMKA